VTEPFQLWPILLRQVTTFCVQPAAGTRPPSPDPVDIAWALLADRSR